MYKRRILAFLLAMVMVVSSLSTPMVASAANNTGNAVVDEDDSNLELFSEEDEPMAVEEANDTVAVEASLAGSEKEAVTIELDYSGIANKVASAHYSGFEYDASTKTISSAYKGVEGAFDDLLFGGSSVLGMDTAYAPYTIKIGDKDTGTNMMDALQYKYQVLDASGTYADMPVTPDSSSVPVSVGKYRAVIFLPETSTTLTAEAALNLEIKKSRLTADVYIEDPYRAGTTVEKLKSDLLSKLTVSIGDEEMPRGKYLSDIAVSVYENGKSSPLADAYVLKNGTDYVASFTYNLKDADNYEINTLNNRYIPVDSLISTKINVNYSSTATILRPYYGKEVSDPAGTEYTAELLDAESKVIENASFTYSWEDANGNELKKAPVDAGAYWYVIKYTDANHIYKDAEAKIKVEVTPINLYIKPIAKQAYSTMTVSQAIAQSSYELYKDDKTTKFTGFDKNTFWGVSYMDSTKEQSYEPVFAVEKKAVNDGKESWERLADNYVLDSKETYRLVWTDSVALYEGLVNVGTDVHKYSDTSINSKETNYKVVLDGEFDAVELPVADVNAVIDVAKITSEKGSTGFASDSIYTTIYNPDAALYKDRTEYKKAVVKADAKEVAKDTDASLSYQWYKVNISEKEIDGVKTPEITGKNSQWTSFNSLPKEVGIYALEISYIDIKQEYVARPVWVYYKIEKQKFAIILDGKLSEYSSNYVGSYIIEENLTSTVAIYPGNDTSVEPKRLDGRFKSNMEDGYGYDYRLETKVLNAEDVALKGNTSVSVYGAPASNSKYVYEIPYALAVNSVGSGIYSSTEFTRNYELYTIDDVKGVKRNPFVLPIDVKKMGEKTFKLFNKEDDKLLLEKEYDGIEIDANELIHELIDAGELWAEDNAGESIPVVLPSETEKTGTSLQVSVSGYLYNSYSGIQYSYTNPRICGAGDYTIKVNFLGDDVYAPNSTSEKTYRVKINCKKVTVTPLLADKIVAGLEREEYDDVRKVIIGQTIDGCLAEDEYAFANCTEKIYSIGNTAGNSDVYLRFNHKYIAEVDLSIMDDSDSTNSYLKDHNFYNYEIITVPTTFTVNTRGNSQIITDIRSVQNTKDNKTTVVPLAAIPYYGGKDWDHDDKYEDAGNYFTASIQAPAEFADYRNYNSVSGEYYPRGYTAAFGNFIYENAIKAAGGFVTSTDLEYGQIDIVFNASDLKKKTFDITWEDGYTETFVLDFTNASLQANLLEAVAPKSLAFNNIKTKMVAGQKQNLDVKIGRLQNSDIIELRYAVVGKSDVVSITEESGILTALRPGTATIEVYPVRMNKLGDIERIDYKPVTANITVSNVEAPKLKSVTAYDNYVAIKYLYPVEGYRREIYVLPGSHTAVDFEKEIAAMDHGQFAPTKGGSFMYPSESSYDEKTNTVTEYAGDLKCSSEYSIYVRNVSGVRTLEDGSEVVLSAAGTVKTIKTAKAQVDSLRAYIEDSGVKYDIYSGYYDVDLTKTKNAIISLRGDFQLQHPAADKEDKVTLSLPLTAKDKESYEDPKMAYAVVTNQDERVDKSDYSAWDKADGYTLLINDYYYKPSNIMKVDKKGKITFQGVGQASIIAYDTVTKNEAWINISVNTKVSRITAKDITLKLGMQDSLLKYLTFYDEKGKKIKGDMVSAYGYVLKVDTLNTDAIGVFGHAKTIVAYKAGAVVPVTVSLGKAKASLTIRTQALDPVAGLKITDVTDHTGTVQFTHTAMDCGNLQFVFEFKDGRGNIVNSYVTNAIVSEMADDIMVTAVEPQKKGFKYTVKFDTHSEGHSLQRLSKYTLKVTPVYFDARAIKDTVKSFKTTNLPITECGIALSDNIKVGPYYGGLRISALEKGLYDIDPEREYLASGNTYRLAVSDGGGGYDMSPEAYYGATDTLTWSVKDSKVATVKANPGSYTATLKAIAPGKTVVEVRSKILKKAVARYVIYVKSVGNGMKDIYGDYMHDIYMWDPTYDRSVEVLTEANPVVTKNLKDCDVTWAMFEAPEDGKYTFHCGNGYQTYGVEGDDTDADNYGGSGTKVRDLTKGQKIYFRSHGNFTLKVSGKVIIKTAYLGSAIEPDENNSSSYHFTFKAPEDNVYTFVDKDNKIYNVSLKAGQEYKADSYLGGLSGALTIKKRDYVAITTTATDIPGINTLSDTENKVAENWFTYKAPAAGRYTFTITDVVDASEESALSNVTLARYYSRTNEYGYLVYPEPVKTSNTADGKKTTTVTWTADMEADDEFIYRVYSSAEQDKISGKISVSTPEIKAVTVDGGAVSSSGVKSGQSVWASFKIDDAAAKYNIFVESDKDSNTKIYRNNLSAYIGGGSDLSVSEALDADLKNDDVIIIEVTNNSSDDSDAKIDIKVAKSVVNKIEMADGVAEKDLTLKNKAENVVRFVAPEYGIYKIDYSVTPNESGESHSIGSLDELIGWVDDGPISKGKELILDAGKAITLKVENNTLAGQDEITTKAKISVTKLPIAKLAYGETKDITVPAGKVLFYEYIASETTNYTLEKSGDDAGSFEVNQYITLEELLNGNGWSVNPTDNNMSRGKKMYVRVKNTDSAEKRLTLTITGAGLDIDDYSGKLTVKAGTTKTVRMLMSKKGYYEFNNIPAGINVESGWTTSSLYPAPDLYVEVTNADIGKYYYIKVSNEGTEDVTLENIFDEVIFESLAAGTETEFKVKNTDKAKVVKFTVPVSGRYIVACDNEKVQVNTSVNPNNNSGNLVTESQWQSREREIFVRVSTTETEEQTAKIKIAKIESVPMVVNAEEAAKATVEAGEKVYFELVVPATDGYLWSVEYPASASFALKAYRNDDDSYITVTDKKKDSYNIFDRVLVALERTDSGTDVADIKLKLTKRGEEIKVGETKTVKIKTGEDADLKFKLDKTGIYELKLEGADTVYANAYGFTAANLATASTSVYGYTKAETNSLGRYMWETIETTSTEEVEVKVTVALAKTMDIKVGDNRNSIDAGQRVFLTMDKDAITETGYYEYKLTNLSEEVVDSDLNMQGITSGAKYFGDNNSLALDINYYLSSTKKTDVNLVYKARKAASVSVGDTNYSLEPNETKYYAYTASSGDKISFAVESGATISRIYNSIYDLNKDSYSYNSAASYSIGYSVAGNTYVIAVTNYSGEKKEGKLTIAKEEYAKVGMEGASFTATAEESSKVYMFTAPEDGEYRFECEKGVLYRSNGYGNEVTLEKGECVYYSITPGTAEPATLKVTKIRDVKYIYQEVNGKIEYSDNKMFALPLRGAGEYDIRITSESPYGAYFFTRLLDKDNNICPTGIVSIGESEVRNVHYYNYGEGDRNLGRIKVVIKYPKNEE